MTPALAVALLACGLFAAAMLHAVVTDLRHGRIRNWLVAALAAGWLPMALAAELPAVEMAMAVAAAALVFAAGFGCFVRGWIGGGDVKLAAVTVLWLGAGQALAFVLLTSVFGGLLAGLVLLGRHRGGARWRPANDAPRPVPYGPALAGAGLALLHGSPWAAAL